MPETQYNIAKFEEVPTTEVIAKMVLTGDIADLSPEQALVYYDRRCQAMGLDPATKPFDYLDLGGKKVLYANRSCTDQLRAKYGVTVEIVDREFDPEAGLLVIRARATLPGGRSDESLAAIDCNEPEKLKEWYGPSGSRQSREVPNPNAGKRLRGEALANVMMKCETKAKRRATLSICGMGMMDESEAKDYSAFEQQQVRVVENKADQPKGQSAFKDRVLKKEEPKVEVLAETLGSEWVLDSLMPSLRAANLTLDLLGAKMASTGITDVADADPADWSIEYKDRIVAYINAQIEKQAAKAAGEIEEDVLPEEDPQPYDDNDPIY